MENEKRLIDANALMDTVENTDWYHISLQGNLAHGARSDIHTPLYIADDIYNAINNAPTVDAVEVVRCKDCKYFYRYVDWYSGKTYNYGFCECLKKEDFCKVPRVNDDDFCSRGERRD